MLRKAMPVLLSSHRAIFGSFERFMAILIEHYAGFLALLALTKTVNCNPGVGEVSWITPKKVRTELRKGHFHVELDSSNRTLGKKLAEARKPLLQYHSRSWRARNDKPDCQPSH